MVVSPLLRAMIDVMTQPRFWVAFIVARQTQGSVFAQPWAGLCSPCGAKDQVHDHDSPFPKNSLSSCRGISGEGTIVAGRFSRYRIARDRHIFSRCPQGSRCPRNDLEHRGHGFPSPPIPRVFPTESIPLPRRDCFPGRNHPCTRWIG
uniref:Uncharacterized protein n=1 Tax=Candidatus Kentrum sp. MB TaxID=2138164 RepID=A0A450XDW2_9GAMM|nr:MAG: hypothetical protein BECKMB1821G_GA0114241_102818 [Candidatus Kentron sp. MB]VFK32046.1 MAG: hypothetical protein BECKMB1821I_GA0114274_102917 [Candidatus Kentron sp. MB]VFK75667.1 MAG: hypothetical protein BECKMB1821H_GA0114242_102831 [Candidatus Kentron sp. MB]